MNNSIASQKKLIIACLMLTPLMCLGLDLYTPSLPAISTYFHTTPFASKLTIIVYLVGFAAMQPFSGLLSDHLERKRFVLIALLVYFISSLLTTFTHSIDLFYFFRVINSICAACTSASIRVMISENFSGKMLEKMNNYYVMGWSLTPIVSPVLGGYLQRDFNWQASFYFMALYALIAFIVCAFLLQKRAPKSRLHFQTILSNWKILLSDHFFIICAVVLCVENTALYLFHTSAPFIIQNELHYNPAEYGQIALFVGASFLVGSIVNGRVLNYFSGKKIASVGVLLSLLVALIYFFIITCCHYTTHDTIYVMTIPLFLIFSLDGLVFSNIVSLVLSRYSHISGTASGLLGGLFNMLAGVLVAIFSKCFNLHDLILFSLSYCAIFFISQCAVFFI